MILLDTDVLLVDLRYPNDGNYTLNRRALDRIRAQNIRTGITAQTLLETVGILSFNLSAERLARLPYHLRLQYHLDVFPDPNTYPDYAYTTVDELLDQMGRRMAMGDAVQAVQIRRFAPSDTELLMSWNAKHFAGKLSIPTYTPEQWLALQP